MRIADLALSNRSLVILVAAAAALGGALASRTLPSGVYPELEFPRIAVVVRQGDAPPQVFEQNVTRPVEEALSTVLGVTRVRSRTIRGGTQVQLYFAPGTDMWRAHQLAQASMSDIRSALPPDATITIERLTPVSFPVLTFDVSGPLDPRELRELTDNTIRPAIARVAGVGRVEALGGDVRELEILVDPERAAAQHLSLEAIAARVRAAIPLATVGRYERDHTLTTVIASAEATSADELASIPIGAGASGAPIELRAVATVREGAQDRFYRTSGPHGDSIAIAVSRLEGASTPEVVERVLAAVDAIRPSLPRGVRIEPIYDQGWLVHESIASVRDAIVIGVALCLLVLGAFLRDVRAGVVAGLAVPLTLAITFLLMRVFHQTLNLMSLGGMAVSIGLVVDDAIVIVEAIARRLELGEPPEQAAREGTRELAAAVLGTTITTVIVFVPLAFLSGIVGELFGALAITLASAVVVSLFVALLVVPVAAASIMRQRPARPRAPLTGALVRAVRWAAARPWVGVLATVLALAFSGYASEHMPSGFLPAADEGAFVIDYFTPAGTSLSDTDAAARRIEQILRETPEVRTFSRRTGAEVGPATVTLLNEGDFVVRLTEGPRRSAEEIMSSIRARIDREVPIVRTELIQLIEDMLDDLSGTPRPIEVRIFGPDRAVLERLASEVESRVAAVDGAVDVYGGVERPSSQLVVDIDRAASARLGLSAEDVALDVRDALLGTEAGVVRRLDRLVSVRVRYPDEVRGDPDRFASLPITSRTGHGVSLGAVAALRADEAPTVLARESLSPVVVVDADLEDRDLGSVMSDIEQRLEDVHPPPGYRIELGGQHASQIEASRNLALVACAGVLLVLAVLVAQLRSLRAALAVLLTAPLALVGALAALWATGIPLDVSSSMGLVLLVGLVVKNGILLVELAEEHARAGMRYADALASAAERRLRPILMTTLATLAGLAPLALALGSGSELQRPLAVAVLGGLTVSTAASLLVLPSLAALLHRRGIGPRDASSPPI